MRAVASGWYPGLAVEARVMVCRVTPCRGSEASTTTLSFLLP